MKVVLEIFFLTFSNTYVFFVEQKLIWRFYTIAKALLNTKQIEIINKNFFTKTALNENVEAFVIYMISLSLNLMLIYPALETQIASLVIKKGWILSKYSYF